MRKLLTLILLCTAFIGFAQSQNKLSSGTRMIIAERDGRISFEKMEMKVSPWQNRNLYKKTTKLGVDDVNLLDNSNANSDGEESFVVDPFYDNGVKKVQVWIKLTDNNTSALENLGAEITSTFDKLVIANVPVVALEQIAELNNVVKVSAAKKLQKKTYYARKKTNADDLIYYSNDAQTAGLLQAYNGQDVVIGVIDDGIQFNHKMFKDENGNTRIKKAYVYANNKLNEYTGNAINNLTSDTSGEDHGTHTSSIAGGSDYAFTGYYYDNDEATYKQATITYGGMAPKADLVLCGLGGELTDANISACIKNISDYADQVGKPCVISISLGSQAGPHDGTGDMADVCAQCTGEGKVILYAASNDGGEKIYLYGNNVTKSAPIMSMLDCTLYDGYASGRYTYNDYINYGGAISYARTPNVALAARAYVVDVTTNTIVWMSNEYTSDIEMSTSTNGSYGGKLGDYFSAATTGGGYLCFYFDQEAKTGKNSVQTVVYYLQGKSYTTSGTVRTGKYKIGVSIYPQSNRVSTHIDSWGYNYTFFDGGTATYNGNSYTFTDGNDKCSISNEATYPSIISVGAYTSGKGYVSADGYVYTIYDEVDDIASFSSYNEPGSGPLGTHYPWITAPGHAITAAYNSGNVANQESSLILDYDSSNPIGSMSGTSMATPCAAGIVALWLQADATLTPEDVKEVMAQTAIKDSYTNNTQFGPNGKINALAGIEYILAADGVPEMIVEPEELSFDTEVGKTETATFEVLAANLAGDVTVTLSDENNVFAIDAESISVADAENGKTISVTFAPREIGSYTGVITLSSVNAEDQTVILNGTARKATPDYYDAVVSSWGLSTMYLDFPVEIPYDAYEPNLLGVYYIYDVSDRSELKLARLKDYIPANTGVIIHGNSGTYRFPKTNVNVEPLKYENYLQGRVEQTTVSEVLGDAQTTSTMYTLGRGKESYVGFYKYGGTVVPAYKAFLVLDNAQGAKGFSFNLGEGAITAITDVNADTNDDEWFTIQGIQLNGKPTQRGLYIHNGKTISIK